MSIGGSLKREEALIAVARWDMDKHIYGMTRSESPAARAKRNVLRDIVKGCPMKIAGIAGSGKNSRMAHIFPA